MFFSVVLFHYFLCGAVKRKKKVKNAAHVLLNQQGRLSVKFKLKIQFISLHSLFLFLLWQFLQKMNSNSCSFAFLIQRHAMSYQATSFQVVLELEQRDGKNEH